MSARRPNALGVASAVLAASCASNQYLRASRLASGFGSMPRAVQARGPIGQYEEIAASPMRSISGLPAITRHRQTSG